MAKPKTPKNKTEKHEVVLKDGEAQLIQNIKGTYILVKVPMVKEHTYHEHPNHALTIKAVQNTLTELSDWCNEGEHETHTSMMYDNMQDEPIQEET